MIKTPCKRIKPATFMQTSGLTPHYAKCRLLLHSHIQYKNFNNFLLYYNIFYYKLLTIKYENS